MTKQIASLYWEGLKAERALYQGYFALPPVKKGDKPAILTVNDHFQIDDEPYFKGLVNGRQRKRRDLIPGEQIVNDLMREWTASHPWQTTTAHPGVWVVRDTVPLFDAEGKPQLEADGGQAIRPATEAEKAQMFAEDEAANREVQANWGEVCIQKADVMGDDVKQIPFIPEMCKKAARYYGRERKWLYALKDSDVKKCPFCTTTISVDAVKCPNCSEVVDRQKYQELTGGKQIAPPLKPNEPKHAAA